MPRPLRPGLLDGTYHITAHGVNQESVFRDDEDRKRYLRLIEEHTTAGYVRVLAYVLMGNHVHLVLATVDTNLSSLVQRVHGIYAARMNRKYGRAGHLFGGRFHCKAVEDDSYLLSVTRYVHRNPVRARIVEHPDQYVWSSYRVYVHVQEESAQPESFVDPLPVLRSLANDRMAAARSYAAFVLEDVD